MTDNGSIQGRPVLIFSYVKTIQYFKNEALPLIKASLPSIVAANILLKLYLQFNYLIILQCLSGNSLVYVRNHFEELMEAIPPLSINTCILQNNVPNVFYRSALRN